MVTPAPPGPETVPGALCAHLLSAPWGQPPALYLIGWHGGRFELLRLPVDDHHWSRKPFHRVVTAAAELTAAFGRACRQPSPAVAGAAASFEGWTVPRSGRCRILPDAHRPGRIERRFILAAGCDGTAWEAGQLRARSLLRTAAYPPGTPPPEGLDYAVDAVRLLARTLLSPDGPAAEP